MMIFPDMCMTDVDTGIVGLNEVAEKQYDVKVVRDLGFPSAVSLLLFLQAFFSYNISKILARGMKLRHPTRIFSSRC